MHKVKVEVTYDDPSGKSQYFTNYFYLHITPDSLQDEINTQLDEEASWDDSLQDEINTQLDEEASWDGPVNRYP